MTKYLNLPKKGSVEWRRVENVVLKVEWNYNITIRFCKFSGDINVLFLIVTNQVMGKNKVNNLTALGQNYSIVDELLS